MGMEGSERDESVEGIDEMGREGMRWEIVPEGEMMRRVLGKCWVEVGEREWISVAWIAKGGEDASDGSVLAIVT